MKNPNENRNEIIPSALAKLIFGVAEQASEVLLGHYRQTLEIDYKRDKFDPVTAADREADNLIRTRLHELFPDDLILTEESPNIPESFEGRVWMVDPLDGTKDFLRGRDCFSINIGLLERGQIVFGCVVIPARGQIFYAENGKGAFQKTGDMVQRIRVSDIQDIREARLVTRNPSGETRPVEEKIDKIPFKERIPEGSIGTKLCLVANGSAEAHINTNFRASKWDTLGPELIVKEAGGVVTDFDGNGLDYTKPGVEWNKSFVASNNAKIHSEIIEAIK